MSGLFGGGSAPALPPVTRMPSLGDSVLRDAKLQQTMLGKKKTGRLSTILSDNLSGNVNGSTGQLGA